ncbi:alpha-protein kinase 2-like [Dendronephthya gigantea]|uniref:alpha-protein kinase 2-like n=1 Tax=Dendronephthya gigantea TaxID=151771 RepID=UPI00106C3EA8|nr:alpha-protein kinase 2-like [Dendronephthya gigantea]
MSSEVSGKQQKYSRIGPQEFVPFDYEELTFENIVQSCQKHFAGQIEKGTVCDILAGERGPSCKTMSQIPNKKVFYVRFIKPETPSEVSAIFDDEVEDLALEDQVCSLIMPQKKIRRTGRTAMSHPSPQKNTNTSKQSNKSKFYPKSLSLKDMLHLGKAFPKKESTIISIFQFNFKHMLWSTVPIKAEFMIEESPFAAGGFRKAFKATSITPGFEETTWVVKKYLPSAVDTITQTKETEQTHTQKSVQMHYLAKNFASQLQQKVAKDGIKDFGQIFEYKKVFMGKTDEGKYVTIEEYIDGEFVKYINNDGYICEDGDICNKAQAFAHFTYEKSEGKLIVLDVQGAGHTLYDPEIATLELVGDDGNYMFCTGNLAEGAIIGFFNNHYCNKYCELLGLKLRPKAK